MSSGELQYAGQEMTQAKAAKGTDYSADEPATPQARRGQVPDGEEHDRGGEAGTKERREQWAVDNRSFRNPG